jgi:hypothetical protein
MIGKLAGFCAFADNLPCKISQGNRLSAAWFSNDRQFCPALQRF